MSNTYDETILINLNSKDAIKNNGSFLSDVYFNFKNIIKELDDVLEIQVTVSNAQIPYSFYNVNVYNNILAGTYNATPFTLTLTRGNYNATNLISESIEYIATPSSMVSDKNFIIDFLHNCDKKTFEKLKENTVKLREGSQLKPMKIKCVNCGHDYEQSLTINVTDFFV